MPVDFTSGLMDSVGNCVCIQLNIPLSVFVKGSLFALS